MTAPDIAFIEGEVDQATPAVAADYLTAGQEIVFLEKRAKR